MGLAAGDQPWKDGTSLKKSPVMYSIVPAGLHVVALSKTVTIGLSGLTDDERGAVEELVGILSSVPQDAAAGAASNYDIGLHNYAKRLMGSLWPFLLKSKSNWVLAKRTLEDYVGRSNGRFAHDDDGRSQYQDSLGRGTSCWALLLIIHADCLCSGQRVCGISRA